MSTWSPNREALLAIAQRSRARRLELEQGRREIQLSKRRLDLEYEELILQRRRLDLEENEIAVKRDELNLTLVENSAYRTLALDCDVQARIALGPTNPWAKEPDRAQHVNIDQQATHTSNAAERSDSSAGEVPENSTQATVLGVDWRPDRKRLIASEEEATLAGRTSLGQGDTRTCPVRNICKDYSNSLRVSMSIGGSITAMEKSTASKVSRIEKKKCTKKRYCKRCGSVLQKKWKRGSGTSELD